MKNIQNEFTYLFISTLLKNCDTVYGYVHYYANELCNMLTNIEVCIIQFCLLLVPSLICNSTRSAEKQTEFTLVNRNTEHG